MRWVRRAGFAVLLLVLAAGAALLLFNPDRLKPRIEAAVLQATGRALTIDGPIQLRLLPAPSLMLHDVSLANRPGGSARPMLTLAGLRLVLDVPALLHGALVASRLELDQPDLLLEADTDGIGNWQFTPAQSKPAPAAPAPPAGPPPSLPVRQLVLHGGRVTLHNAVSGRGFDAVIPDLELRAGGSDAPMSLDGAVALGGRQLQFSLRAGSLAALWSGVVAWPYQLSVTGQGVSLSLQGSAAQPASGNGIVADLALSLDQTALLAGLLPGVPLPALHDLSAKAHVAADVTGDDGAARVVVSDIALTARELAVSGSAGWAGAGAGRVSGALDVARLDLDALGFVPAPAPEQAPTAPALPAAPHQAGWLIPDDPLPAGLVSGAGLDVTLTLHSLVRHATSLGPGMLHVTRADGRVSLAPLSLAMPGGRLEGSLSLSGAPTAPDMVLNLDAQGLAAGPLLAQLDQPPLLTGVVDVHARLTGHGGSPHALAATASGEAGMSVVGGQIETGIATGPLGPLLPQLGVSANQAVGRGALRCLALAAHLVDGQAQIGTLLLDSATLYADGAGELSLRTERMDVRVKPTLRLPPVTGIAIPVRVSGPILRPEVGWDGPALNGKASFSALIGALPQFDAPDRCGPALAAARLGQPGVAAAPAAPAPAAKGLDGILPGLGRLLDRLR